MWPKHEPPPPRASLLVARMTPTGAGQRGPDASRRMISETGGAVTRDRCPLCGEDATRSRPVGPTTVVCHGCSLTYNYAVRAAVKIDLWVEHAADSAVAEYDISRDRDSFFVELWALIRKLTGKREGRLLDIGCGPGLLLKAATASGWIADGLDVAPEMVRRAQAQTRGVVRCGGIEDADVAPGIYDVVALVDVFRCLINPLDSLKRCALMVKPGGAVVMRELNIQHPVCSRQFAVSRQSDLQCLSPATAREFFRRAGADTISIVPSPVSLMSLATVSRLRPSVRRILSRTVNDGVRALHGMGVGRWLPLVPQMIVVGFSGPTNTDSLGAGG